VYKFVQNQTLVQPCTVLHVRRGDVLIRKKKARSYHAIAEYINTSSVKVPIHPNILLLSDDNNAIGEATALFPEYNWMFMNRPRFRGTEGGFEHHLPSSDPIFEMTVILATFQMVKQCQSYVHAHSGFSGWLSWEMKQANSSAQTWDIDQGKKRKEIWRLSNADTAAVISQSYENYTIAGQHHHE
jgi:hypothetical protein